MEQEILDLDQFKTKYEITITDNKEKIKIITISSPEINFIIEVFKNYPKEVPKISFSTSKTSSTINFDEMSKTIRKTLNAYVYKHKSENQIFKLVQSFDNLRNDFLKNKNEVIVEKDEKDTSSVSANLTFTQNSEKIYNRIIWDNDIAKANINIGYIDRFIGIKEMNFETFHNNRNSDIGKKKNYKKLIKKKNIK
jgi:hypothetical protein